MEKFLKYLKKYLFDPDLQNQLTSNTPMYKWNKIMFIINDIKNEYKSSTL